MESLIISFLGGLLGYFSGYVLAFAVSTFLYFPPVFSWPIAAISVGMAMVVGIIFGIYPASRAARKDTIESLRQYH
jgi:ABC-type antimicrobial peptide transport system permease subunit